MQPCGRPLGGRIVLIMPEQGIFDEHACHED